jgi:hypothetical protein
MILQFCVPRCAHAPIDEPTAWPDDGDWEEFDLTPLESWILDDFDWEIEVPYPERGDFWDESLEREWDLAAARKRVLSRGVFGGPIPARRDFQAEPRSKPRPVPCPLSPVP